MARCTKIPSKVESDPGESTVKVRPSIATALAVSLAAAASGCGGNSGNSSSAGQANPTLVRGPFLAEATTTSITIAWSTDVKGTGEVEYGLDLAYGSLAVEGGSTKSHAVVITGLSPGTIYRYLVRTSEKVLFSGGSFEATRPASDPHLRFVAFGDSGSGSADQLAVAARALAAAPDLVIHTGDVIYDRGEAEHFDPFYFEPYAALLEQVPFYTCLGNHDVLTSNGQPYLEAFHLPHNNPQGTERYYSFDAANVHFIALDSNQSVAAGTPMHDWLVSDLAGAADWKIVFFHHPPFSSAMHAPDGPALRAAYEPLFAAGGVDLVLNGHDHVYERTYPLLQSVITNKDQEPNYLNPAGTIYVVTGGGGKSLYARTQTSAFTARFESVFHLVRVEVSGLDLTLTAIRSDGVEIDSMTLSK
jgi:hypothetical protein